MPLPRPAVVDPGTELPAGCVLALPLSRPGADEPWSWDTDAAPDVDAAAVGAQLVREKVAGRAGDVVAVPLAGGAPVMVLLYGVGDEPTPTALRRAGAALVRRAAAGTALHVVPPAGLDDAAAGALLEGAVLAAYSYSLRSETPDQPLTDVVLHRPEATALLARTVAVTDAVALARDLVNTPSAEKTPAWMATRAKALTKRGVTVSVRDEKALLAEGFGGILGVGQGSSRPPRLVELTYDPPGATAHVVLVGKGITFDTGGLSLKRGESMAQMKNDMGGSAAVMGALHAAAALGVAVKVTGLLALAENMPSGSATRPGDVLRHYGGTTVEVLNTDAEGRLVLADALAYAAAELAPDLVVDVATLTGAMPVALGRRTAGFFATSDELAAGLHAAGEAAGEPVWRMPLVEDYRDALDSGVADLRNNADPDKQYGAGSIIAALFLREFTDGLPWAHVDIAGTARADADTHELTRGGTGFGVRLLLTWLEGLGADGRPVRSRRRG